jgi:hypothetical protein
MAVGQFLVVDAKLMKMVAQIVNRHAILDGSGRIIGRAVSHAP